MLMSLTLADYIFFEDRLKFTTSFLCLIWKIWAICRCAWELLFVIGFSSIWYIYWYSKLMSEAEQYISITSAKDIEKGTKLCSIKWLWTPYGSDIHYNLNHYLRTENKTQKCIDFFDTLTAKNTLTNVELDSSRLVIIRICEPSQNSFTFLTQKYINCILALWSWSQVFFKYIHTGQILQTHRD